MNPHPSFYHWALLVNTRLSSQCSLAARKLATSERQKDTSWLWSADEEDLSQVPVQKLVNWSNSCFMNAILQALANLSPLTRYLELSQVDLSCRVTLALMNTLKTLRTPISSKPITPELARVEDVNSSFLATMQQQDASEFLMFLFDWVETEMARSSIRSHHLEHFDLHQALSVTTSGEPAHSSNLIVRTRKRQRELSPSATPKPQLDRRNELKQSLLNEVTKLPVASSTVAPFGLSLALGSSITDWQNCAIFSQEVSQHSGENAFETKLYSNPTLHWLQFCVHRRRREHSLFSPNPFCGLQESSVTCKTCGYASTNYTKFLHLSVPIYGRYTEEELVSWRCDKCTESKKVPPINGYRLNEDNKAVKQMTIARPPSVLCLHLMRLVGGGGAGPGLFRGSSMRKDDTIVRLGGDFESDPFRLNLMPYTSAGRGAFGSSQASKVKSKDGLWYDLVSAIVHLGTTNGGHFITYRRMGYFAFDYPSLPEPLFKALPNKQKVNSIMLEIKTKTSNGNGASPNGTKTISNGSANGSLAPTAIPTNDIKTPSNRSGNGSAAPTNVAAPNGTKTTSNGSANGPIPAKHNAEGKPTNGSNGSKQEPKRRTRDWLYISDQTWHVVSEEQVLKEPLYMLFYVRSDTPQSF